MRPYLTAAALGLAALTASGALAQDAQPPLRQRQPRPEAAPASPTPEASGTDLDATRKRFDANTAKRAEEDRKRDAQLDHSMRSICVGCGEPKPVKRTGTSGAAKQPPLRKETTPSQ